MTAPAHAPRRSRLPGRAELLVIVMLLAVPLVAVQGPAHTTVLDAINALFLALYWCYVLARRLRLAVPLQLPMWLILIGSVGGLLSADAPGVAVLTIAQDVYLYVWFITLADFLARFCRPAVVVAAWTVVATAVALLTVADAHTAALGGQFAGDVRAVGTFENPNMFGNYLVVSFFLCWAAAGGGRPAFYCAMPLLVAGVLSSASNGALLGLSTGTLTALLLGPTTVPQRRVGLVLLAAGAGVVLFALSFERVLEESLGMFAGPRGAIGGGVLKAYAERSDVWAGLVESVARVPTGVGPGNFKTETAYGFYSAHNEYLGMLAERGPLGLLGWCGILLGAGLLVLRLRAAAARGDRPFGVAPLFGLVAALAAHAAVVEMLHFRHVWLALALLSAVAAQRATAQQGAAPRRAATGPPARAARVLVEAA